MTKMFKVVTKRPLSKQHMTIAFRQDTQKSSQCTDLTLNLQFPFCKFSLKTTLTNEVEILRSEIKNKISM